MRIAPLSAVVLLAGLTSSCMVGPDYKTPKADVADQWTAGQRAAAESAGKENPRWWQRFNDPVLNQLIDDAYRNNPSLQAAGVRVLGARAQLNKTIGELFPQQQGVSGQVGYSRVSNAYTNLPGTPSNVLSDQALFSATWELDFWGKYRRGIESDRAAFLGSIAAYDDALVTLISDVASTYMNIRTLEERLRVAAANVESQKEGLRIATSQFNAGATGERDMQQAATQLAQTEAQIPPLEESLRQAKNALAVLLGETPDKVDRRLTGLSRIPVAPDGIALGIPRDLLRRRPDVRTAELNAASACALIGVAKSALYPSFSLSGDFGFASNNASPNSLRDIGNWSNRMMDVGGGVFFPIFNYGRLTNQVRVQDAQFQEAALNYQNTVLNAQREVEDGLAAFLNQQRAVVQLSRAVTSARRSTELALVQYKGGQTDYTTVILAEQTQLAVEDALAGAQGNVVLGIVSVYRALGGGWQIREGRDVVSDEIKADMARRTDWGRVLDPARHLAPDPVESGVPGDPGGAAGKKTGDVKP